MKKVSWTFQQNFHSFSEKSSLKFYVTFSSNHLQLNPKSQKLHQKIQQSKIIQVQKKHSIYVRSKKYHKKSLKYFLRHKISFECLPIFLFYLLRRRQLILVAFKLDFGYLVWWVFALVSIIEGRRKIWLGLLEFLREIFLELLHFSSKSGLSLDFSKKKWI